MTPKYRHALPQMGDTCLLTDSGLETTLVFHDGLDLPHFAAFDLLRTPDGRARLEAYYRRHAAIAVERGLGFILDTPTWRASSDWGARLGYDAATLDAANRAAVAMLHDLRAACETPASPMIVSGSMGPRGDGYDPATLLDPEEAEVYHTPQVRSFAQAGVDMLTVMTMTHSGEAAGIVRAAHAAGVPAAISFTLETDGRLPTGQSLSEAIEEVDDRTAGGPAYYMINCAHPDHFRDVLSDGAPWTHRIRGLRANASRLSHAELDVAEALDDGDPDELGRDYAALQRLLPALRVFGGCCGTDHRHVEAIAESCCGHALA